MLHDGGVAMFDEVLLRVRATIFLRGTSDRRVYEQWATVRTSRN